MSDIAPVTPVVPSAADWQSVSPRVAAEAEFLEILNDFGEPLEILREAVSNAVDWGASCLQITISVQELDGNKRLVVDLEDDGVGMTREALDTSFWGLGFSNARGDQEKIGEKGHGTKTYLRSEAVEVRTQHADGAFESRCSRPLSSLSAGRLHQPETREIPSFREGTGTHIRIVGYNDNQRSRFVQSIVKDYLLWFSKLGSVEREFGGTRHDAFMVKLKCIGHDTPHEEIRFGHVFPEENSDIQRLFTQHGTKAADLYVKKFVWKTQRLVESPEVTFDVVISVEGDEVKRQYNPMLRERRRTETGTYRVGDRYGLWLCKDHIPVERVNEWISGFGAGSNAFVLLHGFINCQSLKLTANRGSIANTDPKVLDELRAAVSVLVDEVDKECNKDELFTLKQWQVGERSIKQEKDEFERRKKALRSRKVARLDDRLLLEPKNESELFGLFVSIHTLKPEWFEFELLDYNTTRGIDLIVRNPASTNVIDGEYWYVELKQLLGPTFNHTFGFLRWVVCWDFDRGFAPGSESRGLDEHDVRKLERSTDNGRTKYFLSNQNRPQRIQVLRLREFLKEVAGIEFVDQE